MNEATALPPFEPGGALEICMITWNLEGTCGPPNGTDLVQPGSHHIYAIGTQECERGIAASYVNRSKSKWEEKLIAALGDEYKMVASETLMAIHIILFARNDVVDHITQVCTDRVATGLLNGTVGNKGGVCVSFLVGNTSMLFVNSHFAAHQNNVADRNSDFAKICFGSSLRSPKIPSQSTTESPQPTSPTSPNSEASKPMSPTTGKGVDITDCFDVVFWCGDLNYRINGLRNMVDVLLKDEEYREVLIANDQLALERKKGNVFQNFQEGEILFRPTYKHHKEGGRSTDEYDKSAKCRIPAWTDRILYKLHADCSPDVLQLSKYTSLDGETLRVSDHRPVVAWFTLRTEPKSSSTLSVANASNEVVSKACIVS